MTVHRERIRWPYWFDLVLLGAAGVALAGVTRSVARSAADVWTLLSLALAVSLVYAWWRMRILVLECDDRGVRFGFGRIGRDVPRDRIVELAPEDYSAARYMGWGYRLGWKPRERAYSVPGYGRGIRVRFDDERGRRWSIFVTAGHPEEAVDATGRKA